MKPSSKSLLSFVLLTTVIFGLHLPAWAQDAGGQNTSSPASGPAEHDAPRPPGMPQWDPFIGEGHNDLPECQPGMKVPCRGKMVIAHPFAAAPQTSQPPQAPSRTNMAQPQHVIAPDGAAREAIERGAETGQFERMYGLPPATVKWLNSPEYKQWAAAHTNSTPNAYWHCYDPKAKKFYGVKVPSLQTPPPASCLPGPWAQQSK